MKKRPFFILLLVWLAGYLTILPGHAPHVNLGSTAHSGIFSGQNIGGNQDVFVLYPDVRLPVYDQIKHPDKRVNRHPAYFFSSTSSSHTGREEKRHKKTLVSEAIVLHIPDLQPGFIYYGHNYSPFLPGGCRQQFLGKSYLRGPPSLS